MSRRRWVPGVVLAFVAVHVACTIVALGLLVLALAGAELPLWDVAAHVGLPR